MDAYCDARALCDSTRKQLKVSAGKWLSYIGEEHFASATPDMAVSWLNGPLATLKARTRYARSRSMRTVYACAVEAGTAASNPFDAPQVKVLFNPATITHGSTTAPIEPHEIRRILAVAAAAADCESGMLTYAAAQLRIFHGITCGELAGLSVADYDDEVAAGYLRVTARNSTKRIIELDREANVSLRNYLLSKGNPGDSEPLFTMVGENSTRVSVATISKRLSNLYKEAGVPVRGRSFKKGLALAAAQAGATGNEVLELVRQKKLSIADCEAFEGADAREAWQSVRLGTQGRFPIASGTATYQQIAEVLVSNRSSDWFDIDVMPDGTTLITPRLFPPC